MKICEPCQRLQAKPATVELAHPWMYAGQPGERVHADFCEYGEKHYLVMVDAFSKCPEVHELGSHVTTTQALDTIRSFGCHGLPHRLVTDN